MQTDLLLINDHDISDELLTTVFYNILGKDIMSQCKRERSTTDNKIHITLLNSEYAPYFSLLQERQEKVQIYIESYKSIWLYITRRESIRLE